MEVAKGKEAIDKELDSKVPFMIQSGGYIPHIDHLVPPEVSWEDFIYYRTRLREMILEKRAPP
jgi:uroporphyrinogen decarboxylase